MRVIPIDVYDKDGNLVKIEVTDSSGEFIIQALWDENDAQTHENRIKFREWTYNHLRRIGHEID
jgi:hypothetical protein